MLYLKEANEIDIEQEWAFVRDIPEDENGFLNSWHNVSKEDFIAYALPQMLDYAKGLNLPIGYVPETFLFLWNDNEIIGEFRLRHHLCESLRKGAGHIGYFIAKPYRGKGFATEGLRLTLMYGQNIVPENAYFLRLDKDNIASLRVMLKNGGRIVKQDAEKIYVRIPKQPVREEDFTMSYKIYYQDDDILIRDLIETDAKAISDAETAQGWHPNLDKYLLRLKDQSEGRSINLVAEHNGEPVGYINVYPVVNAGPYAGLGYPEIVDFGVLEKYRRQGIGNKLMDVAEQIAAQYADTVCIGVGLHSGYGSAQRMYVKRGYIPDGSGVWFRDRVCQDYGECVNDDDLVLHLSKKL